MNAEHIEVRSIFVYTEKRIRAHVFLCMLSWYLEWHMRARLAPMLFEDDDRQGAQAKRSSPVASAQVSDSAKAKADTKRTADGLPVLSMTGLMEHLGTFTLNEVSLPQQSDTRFMMTCEPGEIHARAFSLLNIDNPRKVFTVT